MSSKVVIDSNDPERPSFTFKITGYVKRAVTRVPIHGVYVRSLEGKPGLSGTVRLDNQMDEPMNPKILGITPSDFVAELKEITPFDVYDIEVRTTKPLEVGSHPGSITVLTGLQREPTLELPVQFVVLGAVEPSPKALYLNPATQTSPTTKSIFLYNYVKAPMKITGVKCAVEDIKVTLGPVQPPYPGMERRQPAPTGQMRVTIQLPPASKIPAGGAVIEFLTADPDDPKVELLVTTDVAAYKKRAYGR